MNQVGTDFFAVAVILGGAAVGAASTLLVSEAPEALAYECAPVESSSRVVVVLGGRDGTVVVSPDVEVRGSDECSPTLHVRELRIERPHRVEERVRRIERERAVEMFEGQVRVERTHLDEFEDFDFDFDFDFDLDFDFDEMDFDDMDIDLQGLEMQLQSLQGLELHFEGLDEELQAEIEHKLQEEMKVLEERLTRMNEEIGR